MFKYINKNEITLTKMKRADKESYKGLVLQAIGMGKIGEYRDKKTGKKIKATIKGKNGLASFQEIDNFLTTNYGFLGSSMTLRRLILELKDEGFVEATGRGPGSVYYLTELGRDKALLIDRFYGFGLNFKDKLLKDTNPPAVIAFPSKKYEYIEVYMAIKHTDDKKIIYKALNSKSAKKNFNDFRRGCAVFMKTALLLYCGLIADPLLNAFLDKYGPEKLWEIIKEFPFGYLPFSIPLTNKKDSYKTLPQTP